MSENNTERTLNSSYIPLILAIPINLVILVRMLFTPLTKVEWVSYSVMVLFLLITGWLSINARDKKTNILGVLYFISSIIFILLAIIIHI